MNTLTCRVCNGFLADYLTGDLEPDVRAAFELHLERCRDCRVYLEQYAAVITAGQKVCTKENEDAARAMPEELVQAILQAQAARRPE